ncbi:MAG: hypothetical protein AB6733_05355 [Clostridiaceae bacterium]
MNKKVMFTKSKTVLLIFSLIIFLGGFLFFRYYNASSSKDTTAQSQTTEGIIIPEEDQPEESTQEKANEEPENTSSEEALKEPETKAKETTPKNTSEKITSDNAVEIIKNIVVKNKPNLKVKFDHTQKRDGKDYYVIRLYESLPDHSTTLGWFYVQIDTGKAFQWNLTDDKLTPLN